MVKSLIVTVAVFLTGIGVLYGVGRSQDIIDWWRLRDYTPPVAIQVLASNAGFNDYGDRLFYVHDPVLLNKQSFADNCSVDEVTIVLGCYVASQKIYLFDVQDERLDGVEEVTAAHEMLHAAFDRLSADEQETIGNLLLDFFKTVTNERIITTVEAYQERDSSVVVNELHSIVGTEISEISAPLEQHYKKYFNNRQKVVEFANDYSEEFEKRDKQIADYDSQLTDLQLQIDGLKASIDNQGKSLDTDRSILSSLQQEPAKYNAKIPAYNAAVRTYNASIAELKRMVESYNVIVKERNAIALEERELVEAIDTRIDEL